MVGVLVHDGHEVWQRVLTGDGDAFAQVVQPHLPAMLGAATLLVVDPDEAADAVQDGLIEAWRSRKQLRDPLAFGAWFRTIVLRKALKRARKTRRVIAYTDERAHEPDPGGSYALRHQVLRALAQLDSGDRVVIVLQYYLGFTQQEAAVVLKIPTGTVKSRTHRAMDRLRAAFDAEGRP